MNLKKILVTGGCGFIGSNFIRYMFQNYPDMEIINLDALTYAGNRRNLAGFTQKFRYSFYHGDITDKETVNLIAEKGVDAIINFAAQSHVDRSIVQPDLFVHTNVVGAHVLLEAARRWGIQKMLQISTDEVYGSLDEEGLFTEESPLAPNNPYSASKAGADLLARAYYKTYGLHINIIRCCNNFGPRQFPEKLIPLMILRAMAGKSLPVYGDGLYVRDWIYVEDHCSAIDLILRKGRKGEVYNVGGFHQKTNLEVVKQILVKLEQSTYLINFVHDRPGHDRRYAVDSSKIQRELGWKPRYSFEEGLDLTIAWYQKNLF
ncbi:MAG: dTDP-glucose 4,6-dehydratase [Caldicoprobacterales bacterium]|jgi:dTDP-glucose 4,6-dehydratase|nr:dTDP-glucose 4,6-dehydratase [Clostridiales bacterium]